MDFKDLKHFQRKRNNCEYKQDSLSKGLWCVKFDSKCSLQNCESPPLISSGNQESKKEGYHKSGLNDLRGLSERHAKALKLRNNNKSFSTIAKALRISKTRAYQIVKEAEAFLNKLDLNDKPIPLTVSKGVVNAKKKSARLHNDYIKLRINKVDFILEKTIHLKYTDYSKRGSDKFKDIQIFKNGTLTVRFLKDVVGSSVVEVEKKAKRRLYDFVRRFNVKGINIISEGSFEQLQRDYALIDTDLAKKFIREKRKLFVFDRTDGKCRKEIDFSNSIPEDESVHSKHGFQDALKSEKIHKDIEVGGVRYWDDVVHNNKWDVPSVTKSKIDALFYVTEKFAKNSSEYAENIRLHLEVMRDMKDTLKEIRKDINKGGKDGS